MPLPVTTGEKRPTPAEHATAASMAAPGAAGACGATWAAGRVEECGGLTRELARVGRKSTEYARGADDGVVSVLHSSLTQAPALTLLRPWTPLKVSPPRRPVQ